MKKLLRGIWQFCAYLFVSQKRHRRTCGDTRNFGNSGIRNAGNEETRKAGNEKFWNAGNEAFPMGMDAQDVVRRMEKHEVQRI